MGTIVRGAKAGGGSNFNAGQVIDPAEVNSDLNTIVTEINGELDDGNIKTAEMPGAKSFRFTEIAAPGSPSANDILLYAKDDGAGVTALYTKDSAGTETQLGVATGVTVENRDVTQADVVNTVTETTVYTYTVPGGTLGTTKGLRLTLIGDYLNNSGVARTLVLRAKYGGTTIGTLNDGSTIAADATRRMFWGQVTLQAFNATNAQVATFIANRVGQTSTGVTGAGSGQHDMSYSMHNAVAEDSTTNLALAVTVEHSSAAATISFRLHTAILEEV